MIMLGIGRDEEEKNPRVSVKRPRDALESLSSLHHHRAFSYRKLPKKALITLCILKLDGSFFDIHVASNAVLAVLKQGVEELFSSSLEKDHGKISWPHLWGHFCLCYKGQKLLNDKACIKKFGIKDGDQLQFVQHLSVNYQPLKQKTRNRRAACKQYLSLKPRCISSGLNAQEAIEWTHEDGNINNTDEDYRFKHFHYESDDDISMRAFKFSRFLHGCLSFSTLQGISGKGSNGRSHPFRIAYKRLIKA